MNNILIKSIDRQSGTTENFKSYSKLVIEKGKYLLRYVMIPNTIYHVNNSNNTLILEEGLNTYNITLDIGNYDYSSFSTMLSTILTNTGAFTYTVTINSFTYKLYISSTGSFKLNLQNIRIKSLLGFNDDLPTSDGSNNLLSDNIVNLGSISSVGINISGCSTIGFENLATSALSTFYVPLNKGSGTYVSIPSNELRQVIEFKTRVRQLEISVVDTSTNDVIQLNGGEYEILMSRIE
jgi:hypothetical protein